MTTKYHVSIQKIGGNWSVPEHKMHGYASSLPKIGSRYMVILNDRHRYIHLSEVQSLGEVQEDGRLVKLIIKTLNSTYILNISHTEEMP